MVATTGGARVPRLRPDSPPSRHAAAALVFGRREPLQDFPDGLEVALREPGQSGRRELGNGATARTTACGLNRARARSTQLGTWHDPNPSTLMRTRARSTQLTATGFDSRRLR
jgi:hypothetical protein